MFGPKLRCWFIIGVVTTLVFETNCVRVKTSVITREQAIRQVKVSSLPDWQEAVSEDGRFRVLFPGTYKAGAGGTSEKGFQLVQPETNWFAYYVDYERPFPDDASYLRSAYKGSVKTITRNGRFLLGQKDVFLNSRLGSEFVIDGPGRISYGRAFVSGRRMYILNVDRKVGDAIVNASIPEDIKRFFDSFTYWN